MKNMTNQVILYIGIMFCMTSMCIMPPSIGLFIPILLISLLMILLYCVSKTKIKLRWKICNMFHILYFGGLTYPLFFWYLSKTDNEVLPSLKYQYAKVVIFVSLLSYAIVLNWILLCFY